MVEKNANKKGTRTLISNYMNRNLVKSKRSQVTIFIILAIAIVIVLIVLFYPRIEYYISGPSDVNYVEKCMEDSVGDFIERISSQGGSSEPENYFLYQGDKIEYVCYTNKYYEKCMMQKPFLKQDVEKEIEGHIETEVRKCVADFEKNLEKQGYNVESDYKGVEVSIIPNFITLSANTNLVVSKEEIKKYNYIKTDINSGLYDLLMIASSIANWEARYGDSESMIYMGYYPNVKVEKLKQGDGTTIYILTNRKTQDKFQFASRSIAWPPGYFGV